MTYNVILGSPSINDGHIGLLHLSSDTDAISRRMNTVWMKYGHVQSRVILVLIFFFLLFRHKISEFRINCF